MTARWHLGPITGIHFWLVLVTSPEVLVFLFFMITDPKTAPRGPRARIVYARLARAARHGADRAAATEYWTKVALLSSLALVCLAQPRCRRSACPGAHHRPRPRWSPRRWHWLLRRRCCSYSTHRGRRSPHRSLRAGSAARRRRAALPRRADAADRSTARADRPRSRGERRHHVAPATASGSGSSRARIRVRQSPSRSSPAARIASHQVNGGWALGTATQARGDRGGRRSAPGSPGNRLTNVAARSASTSSKARSGSGCPTTTGR